MADEIEKEKYEHYINHEQRNIFAENNKDSDQDGLKDFEENYFGTDKNNPDTDHDGYTDFIEIKNGHNPLGSGKLQLNNFDAILNKLSKSKETD